MGESAHGPQMLPGGDAVLFTLATGEAWDDARIVVQSLASGRRKVLFEGGRDARYVFTGHLVYAREGTLLARPFDAAKLEVTGGPVSLVEGVAVSPSIAAAQFNISTDGSLLYVPVTVDSVLRTLVWVDRQGREDPLPAAANRIPGYVSRPTGCGSLWRCRTGETPTSGSTTSRATQRRA
jgi:hypothetical protein